jgi:hypothetical protein
VFVLIAARRRARSQEFLNLVWLLRSNPVVKGNVWLQRTFVNRSTGDGTLRFQTIPDKGILDLTGLVRGARNLEATYQEFLNLVWLLRSNPVVKGIIY